ncbi:pyrroloquinoline quinone biosynthesis peptide chaperone PqqD [Limobrevibacterium gyesilva]|uniref:pyrroloquinoline quinone biosynthesis peptide chaperone PqqD n=1 Tax=Limobrevibacterium gyesilva TaxID=2991712 RepID=UPI0038D13AA7
MRLTFDTRRGIWLLLCPERIIELDGPANEILSRCDGRRSVDEIVDDLVARFVAERAVIEEDVRSMLAELAAKRLVQM